MVERVTVKHPAKFSNSILDELDKYVPSGRYLDPFVGTGKVYRLERPCGPGVADHTMHAHREIVGIEIEPEWAEMDPRTVVGDALHLPFPDESFYGIITSPCLAQHEKVLRADTLEWVASGDVETGDRIVAFEEFPAISLLGRRQRRRWRVATVMDSHPSFKECARVILSDGTEVVCTTDHPWLVNRYGYRAVSGEWARTDHLMKLHDPHALRQLDVWTQKTDYLAGWLAGMFDGEGALSWGQHGSPKLVMTQKFGPLTAIIESRLKASGHSWSPIPRKDSSGVINYYIGGGFPGILRFLGEFQPQRLVAKVDRLQFETRTIRPIRVRIEAVELIGKRDIQGITTDTGTYIGAGFLHHNTYGNRFADHHKAKDGSVRRSYTHDIGRDLHPNNSGTLHWGARYREFHQDAWIEASRVATDWFFLNCKNHVRKKEVQPVTEWHIWTLEALGWELVQEIEVPVGGFGMGANHLARVDHESIAILRRK